MYNLGGTAPQQNQTTQTPADVKSVDQVVKNNSQLKTALGKIDTEQELAQLLTAVVNYVNKDFNKNPSNVKSAYNDTINSVPKYYSSVKANYTIKEEEITDVTNVTNIISKYPDLERKLQNINNREELKGIIFNDILANINVKLSQDQNRIVRAIRIAQNDLGKNI
jgi:hypothetical protein